MSNTGNLAKVRAQTKKIVFIDRDGVINVDPIGDYVKRWEDFRFIPGALDALKRFNSAGFNIVIVSNQAGVGDGVYSERDLNSITKNMVSELKKHGIEINGIYYCLHGKEAGCDCRKPKTGLFRQAARDVEFNPSETYFIGDKASDVEAGKNFGLRTLFVLTGHGDLDRSRLTKNNQPEKILPSLKEAADYILNSAPSS
jgi:D-glycero-D-manno-heptose 1,7-bisphosphate phosphatase